MPYVDSETRLRLSYGGAAHNPGELNYLVTQIIMQYIKSEGLRYQTINDIVGALEGAKLEFTRRITIPYEQKKCAVNGDVY